MKSFLIFIVVAGLFGFLMQKLEKEKTYRPEDGSKNEFERRISEEKSQRFRNLYFDLFRNRNINTIMNSMSDLLFQALNMEINNLNRLGLKRDIKFIPKKEKERDESITVSDFGKFSVTEEKLTGNYQESLIDTTNDTVLWKRQFSKSNLTMVLSRNPEQREKKEFYCQGCGSPIKLVGEQFICHNCGAKYSSDSYDWIIGDIKLSNEGLLGGTSGEKTKSIITEEISKKAGLVLGYAIIAVVVASLFLGKSSIVSTLAGWASNFLVFTMLLGGVYYIYLIFPYRHLIKYDKMSSPQRVNERAGYLLRRLMLTYQNYPGKMKAFMDSSFFERWKNSLKTEEDQLIFTETDLSKLNIKKFWVKDGRQHIKLEVATFNLYITPEKVIKETSENIGVILYRNQNVYYQNVFDVQTFYCESCGMPMDLAADGKCRYCGAEYDLADYDWKIEALYNVSDEIAKKVNRFIIKINDIFKGKKEAA
ncbi:hypothetical protein [Petroclostridium sp. X23]|uniref:hypothetical protein n=1 Tax=Petroclostridium sp. X23 TaxID=3045146 RepID=UPI0024ADB5DC|nr:hypothetical protein [Petroclostridium sp. X23]WHH61334.1 hypothetical protein QKW49_11795 [Petroclostridium sp. X23]